MMVLMMWGNAKDERLAVYRSPEVTVSRFGDALGMVNRERAEYATNLVIYAGNLVATQQAKGGSLSFARHVIGLSLHLSSKNRRAVHLDRQLKKGEMPQVAETEYSAETLASLLLQRAEVLFQQRGEENQLLARCFIDLAASLDPKNKKAVHAFELQKINTGEVSWSQFTKIQSSR